MKYMVMECHPGYAVVLDEKGKFSKVANMRYEVGQTVTNVIELQPPETAPAGKKKRGWIYSMAAVAACLLLVVTGVFQSGNSTYASVYMTINPEVRIDVNRKDVVVGLDGINADGETLVNGYDYQKKDLDLVVDELVDRAIEMGFLHEGGKITLTLDAADNEWATEHETALETHVQEHLSSRFKVDVEITRYGDDHDDDDWDDAPDDDLDDDQDDEYNIDDDLNDIQDDDSNSTSDDDLNDHIDDDISDDDADDADPDNDQTDDSDNIPDADDDPDNVPDDDSDTYDDHDSGDDTSDDGDDAGNSDDSDDGDDEEESDTD